MRVSRDARWVLGLVLLIGLGASVLRWRAGGTTYVAPPDSSTSRPRIPVLDKREREREIVDENGRGYVFDGSSLSVCGVQLGMTGTRALEAMGSAGVESTLDEGVMIDGQRGVRVYMLRSTVCGVSGPSLESHGLVIGHHWDAPDAVKARLANAMADVVLDKEGNPSRDRSATLQEGAPAAFSCSHAVVQVKGTTDLSFHLSTSSWRSPSYWSSHLVDYAALMSLHGHPVESWTPLLASPKS